MAKINPNPSLTAIEPKSKQALEQLNARSNIFLAIISGRPMYNVRKRVGIDNATYSGNHGMEILFTNKTEFHYPITAEMYANCLKLKSILTTQVRQFHLHKKKFKSKQGKLSHKSNKLVMNFPQKLTLIISLIALVWIGNSRRMG